MDLQTVPPESDVGIIVFPTADVKTTFGSDGASVKAPMESDGSTVKSGSHVVPPSMVFHTPPPFAPK